MCLFELASSGESLYLYVFYIFFPLFCCPFSSHNIPEKVFILGFFCRIIKNWKSLKITLAHERTSATGSGPFPTWTQTYFSMHYIQRKSLWKGFYEPICSLNLIWKPAEELQISTVWRSLSKSLEHKEPVGRTPGLCPWNTTWLLAHLAVAGRLVCFTPSLHSVKTAFH